VRAAFAQAQGHGRRQVAAGALAGHGHRHRRPAPARGGVGAELGRLGQRPPGHRLAVVEAGGERVLGRQPVRHRDHDRARGMGQLAGHVVHEPDAADDEAAAVEVHDHARGRALRAVEPHGNALDDVVLDVGHRAHHGPAGGAAGQLEDRRVEGLERRGHHRVGRQPLGHPGVEDAFVVHGDLLDGRGPPPGRPGGRLMAGRRMGLHVPTTL
jgi:hypothetical protein